jgi:hypothetical protein
VAAIQQQYPLSNYLTPSYAYLKALTDYAVGGNNRTGLCNVHLANQISSLNTPTYAYEFGDVTAPYPAPVFNPPLGGLVGAFLPVRPSASNAGPEGGCGRADRLLDELRGDRQSER